MIEINNAVYFHPERADEKFNGRVFLEANNTFLEINNLTKFGFFIDVLWVLDEKTNSKFSFINLFIKTWGSAENATFKVSELYEGSWVSTIEDKNYRRCIITMSGLALWIGKPLISCQYEKDAHIFKVKDEEEKHFQLKNNVTVTFRKYNKWQRDYLSLDISEKASLILSCNEVQSRKFLNELVQSFKYILSIFLPVIPKVLEMTFEGEQESCLLKLEQKEDDILSKNNVAIKLDDLSEDMFNKWIVMQDRLNEICILLTESRENIVAETSFTYCAKSLELIYKYLFMPKSEDSLTTIKQIMKEENVWEANWDKNNLTIVNSNSNFRVMLCILWKLFDAKNALDESMIKPYIFMAKVHRSRNYYTHYNYGDDIFKPSQLFIVNKILTAFAYGLILQYLEMPTDKIYKLSKSYAEGFFSFAYDSNLYSLNYKHSK